MYPDEYRFYEPYRQQEPYQPQPQFSASATTGVLDRPQTPPEQDAFQPPRMPSGPTPTAAPPRKPRRGGAIVFLTLVLLIIFGVGLFSGWEFSHSSTVTTTQSATTAQTIQAQSSTSSSSTN